MAKLHAHGTEVARIRVTKTYNPPKGDVDSEVEEYSFRSDGHILKRIKTHWCAGALAGEWHDYRWKLHNRFSDRSITVERIRAYAQRRYEAIENRDWELPDTTLEVEIKEGGIY